MTSIGLTVGSMITTEKGQKLQLTIQSNGKFGTKIGTRAHYWHPDGSASSDATDDLCGDIQSVDKVASTRALPTFNIDAIITALAPACSEANKYRVSGYKLLHKLMADRESINALDVLALPDTTESDKAWILSQVPVALPAELKNKAFRDLPRLLKAWTESEGLTVTVGHYYETANKAIMYIQRDRNDGTKLGIYWDNTGRESSHTYSNAGTSPSASNLVRDLGRVYIPETLIEGMIFLHVQSGAIRMVTDAGHILLKTANARAGETRMHTTIASPAMTRDFFTRNEYTMRGFANIESISSTIQSAVR